MPSAKRSLCFWQNAEAAGILDVFQGFPTKSSAKSTEKMRAASCEDGFLRQYRTIIVVRLCSQIFRQIAENDEVIPAYFEEFLAKMTENMQASGRQRR